MRLLSLALDTEGDALRGVELGDLAVLDAREIDGDEERGMDS